MDRGKLEKILTCFQAYARGYLVRNEVRRAREDFEDVVREIDGGLTHLEWRETVIPIPHFTDTVSDCNSYDGGISFSHFSHALAFAHRQGGPLRPRSSTRRPSQPDQDVYSGSQTPLTETAPASEARRDHSGVQERTEAERDDSQIKGQVSLSTDCFSNRNVRGAVEGEKESTVGDKDGGVMDSTGESTTAWSSLELDMNYGHSHKGSRQYCFAQELPSTPEALRLHRNTLTMELLWLQQAIDSRKKYLSLKDRLSAS